MRVFAVTLLSAVMAIGCSREEVSPPAPASAPAPAAAAAPFDLQFLDTMTKHHQGAIDMARAAEGKVTNSELKNLIARIPADQQKEIDQMKSWREQWYPGAPPAENMSMPGMAGSMTMDMSHLTDMKAGTDYDVMFIDMMVPHHQGALTMSRDALGKAEHPELKTLAQNIIDAQQKEIDEMNRWKAAWRK